MSRAKKLIILDNTERKKSENNHLIEDKNSDPNKNDNEDAFESFRPIKRSSSRQATTKRQRKTISEIMPRSNILNKFFSANPGDTTSVSENSPPEEAEKLTLRQIFDRFFTPKKLDILKIVDGATSLLSFIFYVVCSYKKSLFKIMDYVDIFVVVIYIFYFLIELILAHHRLSYILSLNCLIQVITMLPIITQHFSNEYITSYWYMLTNSCRVTRYLRVPILLTFLSDSEENSVSKQIITILNTIFNMIFVSAGLMQIVERPHIEILMKKYSNFFTLRNYHMRIYFHHYLYFIVVTISTVGYGDIYPITFMGKLIFVVLVFLILIVIPYQINDLITIMSAQSDYARTVYKSSNNVPHVVIVGNILVESLKIFCNEYYANDGTNSQRHIVILNKNIPNKELEIFLQNKFFEKKIYYLQGDPMNENDLLRTDISRSRACIIFNNPNIHNSNYTDLDTILLGLFIKKYVFNSNKESLKTYSSLIEALSHSNPGFHLCIQLNTPESIENFRQALQSKYKRMMREDQLIVIESTKMKMLAKSCLTPGIMVLLSNLITTHTEEKDKSSFTYDWLREYSEGLGQRIFRVQLPKAYFRYSFIDVAELVYNKAQMVVFGLEIDFNGQSIVRVNPVNDRNITIAEMMRGTVDKSLHRLKSDKNVIHSFAFRSPELNSSSRGEKTKVYIYLIYNNFSEIEPILNKEINERLFLSKRNSQQGLGLLLSRKNNNNNIIRNLIDFTDKNEEKKDENTKEIDNLANAIPNLITGIFSSNFLNPTQQNTTKIPNKNNNQDSSNKIQSPLLNLINNNNNGTNPNTINTHNTTHPNTNPNTNAQNPAANSTSSQSRAQATATSRPAGDERKSTLGVAAELLGKMRENVENRLNDSFDDSSSESEEDEVESERIKFNSLSQSFPKSLFHLNPNPNFFFSDEDGIIQSTIEDREEVTGHIILCGLHPSVIEFILPLRAKYIRPEKLRWIVIIAATLPPMLLNDLNQFTKIFFIQGSPLDKDSLRKAKIEKAQFAVIMSCNDQKMSKQNIHEDKSKVYTDEEMLDAETIFTYKSLKNSNNNIQIMTELVCTKNIEYLLSGHNLHELYVEKKESSDYVYTPIYASGEVFTPSLIDSLTCQSYFDSHLISILDILLGYSPNISNKERQNEPFSSSISSNLYLIKVPSDGINEAFGDFFYYLLHRNAVALGLYRKNEENGERYVYTNPRKTTLLKDTDMIFVLSSADDIVFLDNEKNISKDAEEEDYDDEENEKSELSISSNPNSSSIISSKKVLSNIKQNKVGTITEKMDRKQTIIGALGISEEDLNALSRMNGKNCGGIGEKKRGKKGQFGFVKLRLEKLKKKLEFLRSKFSNFNSVISNLIDQEIENEMKNYIKNC